MTSVAVSGIMFLLCIALFIMLCFKGHSPAVIGLICCVLISIATPNGFVTGVFSTATSSIGATLASTLLPFSTGSILGEFISCSRVGKVMGDDLVKRFKSKAAPLIIFIFSAILNLLGMANVSFFIAAFSIPVLAAANLPCYIGLFANTTAMTIIGFAMPGSVGLPNILAGSLFGNDSLVYAPLAGICMTVAGCVVAIFLLMRFTKKARESGEGYSEPEKAIFHAIEGEKFEEMPSLFIAYAPVVIVIAMAIILTFVVGAESDVALVCSQITAVLFIIATCKKYIEGSVFAHFADSFMMALNPIMNMCVVGAFAVLVTETSAYNTVINGLLGLNIHPYFGILIATSIIAAITSDGIATLITLDTTGLAQMFNRGGASPEMLSQIAKTACAGFDTLPYSSTAIYEMSAFGYTHKTGYKYVFISTVILPFVMLAVGLTVGFIFY